MCDMMMFIWAENGLRYWSVSKPFVVSVSVKSKGCDGYPGEDSDESCECFLIMW